MLCCCAAVCFVPEIDIVITRPLVLQGKWEELYEEVKAMRQVCKRDQKQTETNFGGGGGKMLLLLLFFFCF